MDKNRFKGDFNYNGQVFTIYKYAKSGHHAYFLMTRDIAKRVGLRHANIKYYFNGIMDNYRIQQLNESNQV